MLSECSCLEYLKAYAVHVCFTNIDDDDDDDDDVQLHWNNPRHVADLADSSGLTIYYTANLRANDGDVLLVGQTFLEVPPGQPSVAFSGNCSKNCTSELPHPIYLSETLLHMHLLGTLSASSFSSTDQTISSATAEIARVGGHYAVQGHSLSLILISIESPYTTSL